MKKQRTINSLFINGIDAFCSVAPYCHWWFHDLCLLLSAASFVRIYLVSYNIGYQFQELSYFINTRKSVSLSVINIKCWEQTWICLLFSKVPSFLSVRKVSVDVMVKKSQPCDLTIEEGMKRLPLSERKWFWKNNLTEPNLW